MYQLEDVVGTQVGVDDGRGGLEQAFQPGPLGLGLGPGLLQFLSVSGFFITAALTYTGGLQGAGDTKSPFYISVLSQIILPLSLLTVLGTFHKVEPTDIWIAIVIGHATRCVLSVLRFRQGRWRSIAVDLTAGP